MTRAHPLQIHRLGTLSYERGLDWQLAALEAVRAGASERRPEHLAVLEHTPVYTLGARARRGGLRIPEVELPAPLFTSDRGGDVTFHGPGQLVAYPVLDLRSRGMRPGDYVRALEEVVLISIAAWGIEGERWQGRPGVWVGLDGAGGALAKVAAVGVRVREGITQHGLALNVTTDLGWYDPIVPCGIEDATVTSLECVLGRAPSMAAIQHVFIEAFAAVFNSASVANIENQELAHV
ncbi:MAG: lipoyl(octanoyl) transferase LipB [Dehalococcoidia bacterium]|nr:lipoyl(octanoyl) transferase LipB [Dehalococcoidia bacterium]